MKIILIAWLAFNGLPPDNVSGYQFESEADCLQNVAIIERGNANVHAVCVTEVMWKTLGGQ